MRLSRIVISLPLLLCAAQFANPLAVAQAAPVLAQDATVLLAKSHAINVKCAVLASGQSQELKDFVARAEISLAEKASVATARKAIADGRNQGKAAVCDQDARQLVMDVLAAATAAASAVVDDKTTSEAVPEVVPKPSAPPVRVASARDQEEEPEPQALAVIEEQPVPKKKVVVVKPQKVKAKRQDARINPTQKVPKGLGAYAGVAERYYVALRCGNMGAGQINQLYKTVLANHRDAVANNKRRDVRAALKAAEGRANTKSCS